jgi:hypothetical protein
MTKAADVTVRLPQELVNLHRIAGLEDSYRAKLYYVQIAFGQQYAVAAATNSSILAVFEWKPFCKGSYNDYEQFFEDETFYIHAGSLKVVNYMQSQFKDGYGSHEVYLTGEGKLRVCDHTVETPKYPFKDEWLDWKQAIAKATQGTAGEVVDPSMHGSVSEVTIDLRLLDKIHKYLKSCRLKANFHFKFTSEFDVIQGRLGTVPRLFHDSGMHMDFFIMPMRQESGKWEVRPYLRKMT